MKCNRCGAENNDANKFCTNCGNELIHENNPQEIICESCGAKNKPENNYCILCGERLRSTVSSNVTKLNLHRQYHDNRKKNKKRSNNLSTVQNKNYPQTKKIELRPFLITAVVIIVSYITVTLINNRENTNTIVPTTEIKSTNPAVEAIVYEIASKFVCSCGSCNEESLEKCTCPRAVEERQFIRDYVEKNGQQKNIVVALANRYGYLKSEYAKDYKVDASKIWQSDASNSFSNSKGIIK